jgi:hypothetical protein
MCPEYRVTYLSGRTQEAHQQFAVIGIVNNLLLLTIRLKPDGLLRPIPSSQTDAVLSLEVAIGDSPEIRGKPSGCRCEPAFFNAQLLDLRLKR